VKGVILAGGTGSRLHPLTRITNKHLLPVYDKPMIFYPIETLASAGIDEIMIVTGGNHAGEFLPLLGNGSEFGLHRLQFSYQAHAGGIAEALGLCESFVDGDKVVVMLGDNILGQGIAAYVKHFVEQSHGGRILLKEMEDPTHLRHLGVPIFGKDDRLTYIREKPETPPSPYAVIGIYMYDPGVFDIVRSLKPSGRGELEITDVNNAYVDRGLMEYDVIDGFWGDAGESIDVYYSVIDYVREHGANRAPRLQTSNSQPIATLAI
jgi:glucose-1-phosphate thymidylyltransferase